MLATTHRRGPFTVAHASKPNRDLAHQARQRRHTATRIHAVGCLVVGVDIAMQAARIHHRAAVGVGIPEASSLRVKIARPQIDHLQRFTPLFPGVAVAIVGAPARMQQVAKGIVAIAVGDRAIVVG